MRTSLLEYPLEARSGVALNPIDRSHEQRNKEAEKRYFDEDVSTPLPSLRTGVPGPPSRPGRGHLVRPLSSGITLPASTRSTRTSLEVVPGARPCPTRWSPTCSYPSPSRLAPDESSST